jgi:hypothetical protein
MLNLHETAELGICSMQPRTPYDTGDLGVGSATERCAVELDTMMTINVGCDVNGTSRERIDEEQAGVYDIMELQETNQMLYGTDSH